MDWIAIFCKCFREIHVKSPNRIIIGAEAANLCQEDVTFTPEKEQQICDISSWITAQRCMLNLMLIFATDVFGSNS